MSSYIVHGNVKEGCAAINDGQHVRSSEDSEDGVLITQSDVVGSIPFSIFEGGNATPIYTASLAKTDIIRNTPVPWRLDPVGRNLIHRVNPDALGITLKGGKDYEMVYEIELAEDGPTRAVFIWTIDPLEA